MELIHSNWYQSIDPMGLPGVNQRVDEIKEEFTGLEISVSEMVSKAFEKAMEAVRESLAEWAMESQTTATKQRGLLGRPVGCISRGREDQEAPFNPKRDEHNTLQAGMTSTLKELKLTSEDKVEGSANRPGMASSGLIVSPCMNSNISPCMNSNISPCMNPKFGGYDELGKKIGLGGHGQTGIGFGVGYMASGSGGGPGGGIGVDDVAGLNNGLIATRFIELAGKISDDVGKVRLVCCPNCEILLTELPDYSIYQCGACGTVLRAREKDAEVAMLLENLGEARAGGGVSEKFSDSVENSEYVEKPVMNSSDEFGNDVSSNGTSTSRLERKEIIAHKAENYRNRSMTKGDKKVVEIKEEMNENRYDMGKESTDLNPWIGKASGSRGSGHISDLSSNDVEEVLFELQEDEASQEQDVGWLLQNQYCNSVQEFMEQDQDETHNDFNKIPNNMEVFQFDFTSEISFSNVVCDESLLAKTKHEEAGQEDHDQKISIVDARDGMEEKEALVTELLDGNRTAESLKDCEQEQPVADATDAMKEKEQLLAAKCFIKIQPFEILQELTEPIQNMIAVSSDQSNQTDVGIERCRYSEDQKHSRTVVLRGTSNQSQEADAKEVLSTDGSSIPIPITVTVSKFGKCEDLVWAVSVSCFLRNDETLLLAEIYGSQIMHFLDKPDDSLDLLRDSDQTAVPGYFEKLGDIILKRFLLLVLILDRAKCQSSLPINHGIDGLDGGSPILFTSQSTVKSSQQMIQDFLTSDVMHGEGNLLAQLVIVGFKVFYMQSPLSEYDFRVTNLFEDLQDGVRLCRAVQLLQHGSSILTELVFPSDTCKKILMNCGIAFQHLKQAGVVLYDEDDTVIVGEDIVNGDKELTFFLLWNIIVHLQAPLLINKFLLSEEIHKIRGVGVEQLNTGTPMDMLLHWIQAICESYNCNVDNFAINGAFVESELVFAYARDGMLDEAMEFKNQTVEKGMKPDIFTYTTLLSGFEKAGKDEAATRVYEEMNSAGCNPNICTFNSPIKMHSNRGNFKEMMMFF